MDVLFPIFTIAIILLVASAAACLVHLSSLHMPRHEVQRFFVALEDLVLPMGSFPSELLGRPAPTATDLADTESGVEEEKDKPRQEVQRFLIALEDLVLPMGSFPSELLGLSAATTTDLADTNPDVEKEKDAEQQGHLAPTAADLADAGSDVEKMKEIGQQEEQSPITDDEPKSVTPSQIFENAIRELVDPEGTSVPDLQTLAQLAHDAIERRAQAEKTSRSEAAMSQRAEEDTRHEWEDKKEVWEKIISGQNKSLSRQNAAVHSLTLENMRLGGEIEGSRNVAQERQERLTRRYIDRIETLRAAKQQVEQEKEGAQLKQLKAQKDKEDALVGVEDRIAEALANLKKDNAEAKRKHQDMQSSLIRSRRLISDDLVEAREQLAEAAKERETAVKDKETTIDQLRADLSQMKSRKVASEDVAASEKRRLEERSNLQCKQRDDKISDLNNQLRQANDNIKALGGYKAKAQVAEQRSQRLSDLLQEEKTRLREDKEHVVSNMRLELGGHKRTIKANEDEIEQLQGKITALESGEEISTLKAQLQTSKKQVRASAREMQDSKKQAQDRQNEIDELRKTVKAQSDEITEGTEKASNEKDRLEKELEVARTSNVNLKEAIERCKQDFEEHKKTMQDAAKNAAEFAKVAEETVRQTLQKQIDDERQSSRQMQEKMTAAVKAAEDNARQAFQTQVDEKNKSSWHAQETTTAAVKEAEESLRQTLQKHLDDERQTSRQALENMKAAAKFSEESVRQTLQKQLDDERQTSRQALERATKTENDLRAEMHSLKSQVEKVAETQNSHPASVERSQNAQAMELLDKEASDVNNLLLELGKNAVVRGSREHALLCQLNAAKLALYRVKREIQNSDAAGDKIRLARMIEGVIISEPLMQQLDNETQLVQQAKMTNVRVRNVEKVLDEAAEVVEKDAIVEALNSTIPFVREIRKLRRPMQSRHGMQPSTISTGDQTGSSSIPTSNPQGQITPSFADILATLRLPTTPEQATATVTPNTVAEDNDAPDTTATAQSQLPGLSDDDAIALDISLRPKRKIRTRKLFAAEKPNASPPESTQGEQSGPQQEQVVDTQQGLPSQHEHGSDRPKDWTDEITAAVNEMLRCGDDIVQIEETIKALYDVQEEGLEKWLEKLQSEYEAGKKDQVEQG